MIDSSPRPLPQSRLRRLVHGLQLRMGGSLQQTQAEIETLQAQMETDQRDFATQVERLQAEQVQAVDDTTTLWDEEIHACWNEAELRTYRALFETVEVILFI